MRGFPKLTARLPDGGVVLINGRQAETAMVLVNKGTQGATAYDFPAGPPFRLAAYVCGLRHDKGLAIETRMEPHSGGFHAVYVLHTPLRLTDIVTE